MWIVAETSKADSASSILVTRSTYAQVRRLFLRYKAYQLPLPSVAVSLACPLTAAGSDSVILRPSKLTVRGSDGPRIGDQVVGEVIGTGRCVLDPCRGDYGGDGPMAGQEPEFPGRGPYER